MHQYDIIYYNAYHCSRQNAFGLVVALDEMGSANGDLFWDDGESIGTVAAGQYHYSTFSFENVSLCLITFND
jgi:hypothetical protein